MPIDPNELRTGGALQGAVAASLVRQRDAAAELAPGTRIGIYRVMHELARGGMAIVYLAERADGEYEQQVALKWMLQAQPDAASEALFRRERQALADLRHPHIARLLDGGRSDEGRPWFAMELIAGERLDTHCVQAGLPVAHRLILFQQVCAAIAFAHARGVIHRDIKPSNVLVDSDGSAKLLDFGIAQLLGQDDALGAGAYTPGFASPEQVRGEPLTVQSDVYQLGRLLASLLSAHAQEQATIATLTHAPVPLGDAAVAPQPAVPAGLHTDIVAILRKACATDPLQRYPTADALAADVAAMLARQPVAARPRTAAYVTTRFLQRHPFGIALAAMALTLLIGGAIFFTARLAQERNLAQRERDAAAEQARISNAALAFVRVDLLAAADPANSGGRDVTVRETLDRAADTVGDRFKDAPLEEATVRLTLADVYQGLGDLQQAEIHARAGVEAAARSDSPAAAPLGAYIRLSLAMAIASQRRLDEAIEALPVFAEGDSGDSGLEETHIQADLLRSNYVLLQDKLALAEELAASAAERALRLQGENGRLYNEALFYRATPLRLLGRFEEALDVLQRVYALDVEQLGPDHIKLVAVQHLIGTTLRQMGRPEEAVEILRKVIAARSTVLGVDHHQTLSSMRELATALQDLGRYEEAAQWFESVLETALRLNGPDHSSSSDARNNLGLFYLRSGQLDEADKQFAELFASAERQGILGSQKMLTPLDNLASLRREQKRYAEAEEHHRELAALDEKSLGPDDQKRAFHATNWATTLDLQGRCAEAEAKWKGALALLVRVVGEDHLHVRRLREAREKSQTQRAGAGHADPACTGPPGGA